MSDWMRTPTLAGRRVRLEALQRDHVVELEQAAADGELWRLWYASVPARDGMPAYVDKALAARQAGTALPFVVRAADGRVVGTTRFYDIDVANRRALIGYTWYARSAQRTGINTEAKLLLLAHAFEQLGAIAVELRTHWMNQASRAAILRLGARQDGVLRNHMILPDGSRRDTVVFSIIDAEWPAVKRNLQFLLEQREST